MPEEKEKPKIKLEFDPQNPDYELIETDEQVATAVKELQKREVLAVDTEASELDPYNTNLVLVQVGTPNKAYIFQRQKVNLSPLKPLLEDPQRLKIVQNGKFDYQMLKVNADITLNNIFDTMLAERILTTGFKRENSLEALANDHLQITLDKDIRYTFGRTASLTKKQLKYAALDILVLFPLFKIQFRNLQKEKLTRIAQLEFRCLLVVAEMELKGARIDVEKWRKNLKELKEKRDLACARIQEELRPLYQNTQVDLFGAPVDIVNLNSPVQILEAFRRVGIDLPSTGEAVLRRTDHPLAKMLLEYRGHEKLLSAFGENLLAKINPKTGRIHPDYMQIGADTGRFACSNPNLQQIPKESTFRSCFVPAPGYKFIVADYSQIELRVMAEASEDPAFMKAYKEDKDLHTLTASQMFGIPEERVRNDVERFQAKSINFGLMYGRGANSLATQLEISPDEAKTLLNKYFRTYSKVKSWLDKVGRDAIRQGYSMTLGGRKRWYNPPDPSDPSYERRLSHFERQGKNTPIQGTSADMTKYALVYVYDRIKEKGYDACPVHTIHDEIVLEVRDDQAEEVRNMVEKEMLRAAKVLLKKVPVKVDAKVSDVWEH
jgi:DNA polymerase-1